MPNFINVGGVNIEVRADGTLAKSEITKLEKQFDKSGNNMSKTGGKLQKAFGAIKMAALSVATAIAGAFVGVIAWMKKAIPLASDFNEANNRLLTVFKGIKGQASAAARGLTSYGFSLIEATKTLGSVGDVLTGLGMGQQSALKMSDSIARLSQDLVSFTNFSGGVAGASDIITKALLGERDGLISLGVKLNDVDLRRMGYTENMSREAKAELTLKAIMQQSKNAMGDYARTQNSFANSTRKLGQNFKDLTVRVGQKLLPAISGLVSWMNKQFEKSKDLSAQTETLIDLLKQRKDITEKLSESQGKLNETEQRTLEIQKLQNRLKLLEVMDNLSKAYNKYYTTRKQFGSQRNLDFSEMTKFINTHGQIQGYGKTQLDAMKNAVKKLNTEYKVTLGIMKKIKSGEWQGSIKVNMKYQHDLLVEINNLELKIKQTEDNRKESIINLAKAYKQGLLSVKDMLSIPEELRKAILKMSNDPSLFKSHPLQIDTKLNPPKKKDIEYWKANFVERMKVKIDIGYDKKKAEKELADWLDNEKHKAWYNTIRFRIEANKSVTADQKKYLDEYIAAQQELNSLKKTESELDAKAIAAQKQKLEALQSSLKNILGDLDSVAGTLSKNVSPETQKTLDAIKEWKKNLQLVIKVVNDVSTAVKAAEKAQATAKISAGDWVAIIASAISLLVSAWDAIFNAAEQRAKDALKSVDKDIRELEHKVAMGVGGSLQQQIEAYRRELQRLQAVKQTDDIVQEEYQLEEKIYSLKQQERAEQEKILNAYKAAYALQVKTLGGGTAQGAIDWATQNRKKLLEKRKENYQQIDKISEAEAAQKKPITDEVNVVIARLKKQYEQGKISKKRYEEDFRAILKQYQSKIQQVHTKFVSYYDAEKEKINKINIQLQETKKLLASLQDEALKESVTKFEHEVSMGQHQDIREQIDFYKQKLADITKHNQDVQDKINKLLGEGKDFTDDQVKLLAQQLIGTSDIYSIEEKIHNLKQKTTGEMQKQLDIQQEMNRLKKTGLFDEQNLYQASHLGELMRAQNYSMTRQIDVMSNLNIGDMAGHRVVNIYGGINTSVNEATGDSLDEAMNRMLVNIMGGM